MERYSHDLACPRCHALLEQAGADELVCRLDGLRFERIDGIWRMLLPEREPVFRQFMQEFEAVRRAEGRGSKDPAYYRSLPFRDLSRSREADWRIRASSFKTFLNQVVTPLERSRQRPLRAADLGAGNGWLSYHLAKRGHAVTAVDLLTNDFDGLGCRRHYDAAFEAVQAEFDRLPLPGGAYDLVVFNASLHYSTCYEDTLREAVRLLQWGGVLAALDTPVYRDPASGAQMVREREEAFRRQVGFPSNALASENYLTYRQIRQLSGALGLEYRLITPFYGLGWMLRPVRARLVGSREPAKFHVIVWRGTGGN